ncbi:MAG TPA: hypothetical protein VMZ73_02010 [Acidimicrobiales bacterium]|nr:hypothetical protein [Acidimicrobiales bacterium]
MTALLMAGVLALGLAACGDDGDEKSTATTAAPVTTPVPKGAPMVSIDMVENAFQVSGALTAGGTLKFSNKGTEIHMALVQRFKPGKTMTDLQLVLSQLASQGGPTTTAASAATTTTARGATTTTAQGATTSTAPGATTTTSRGATTTTSRGSTTTTVAPNQNPFVDVLEDSGGLPGAVMSPGEIAEVTVPTLQVGSYALICFVPGEGDGVPHFAEGMVGQLDVVAGDPPPVPTADVTYKLAPGKAVEGPATLTAGRHTMKFEAAAGSAQLEPALARLNPGATFTALDAAITKLFESDTPPAKGSTAKLPGQIVYGGLDLGTVTAFYLTVELKAGTYVIDAEDTDVTTKGTPKELITIKVS